MAYTNEQYLSFMKDFFVSEYKNASKANEEKSEEDRNSLDKQLAFSYMVELFGLSELPKVVPDGNFDKIASRKFYRGVETPEHIANLLCDFIYHYGTGDFSEGIYISPSNFMANCYTFDHQKPGRAKFENVLTLKLDPSTKICYFGQIEGLKNACLKKMNNVDIGRKLEDIFPYFEEEDNFSEIAQKVRDLLNFFDSIEDEEEKVIFGKTLINDDGKLAIYLGFDAIIIEDKIYALFNRGKMIVSQSEFVRFVSNSKGYNRDGTIKRLSGNKFIESEIPQKD